LVRPDGIRTRSWVRFRGVNIIRFRADNQIMDVNGSSLGSYSSGQWIYVKIQIVSENPYKIIYWINNGPKSTCEILSAPTYNLVSLPTSGGTVWFDEVEVYDFNAFPTE